MPVVSASFHLLSFSLTLEPGQELATAPTTLSLSSLTSPSSPAKGAVDSDDGVAVEASGSTSDHDRDSARGISEDEANQGVQEPDSGSELQMSATDSDQNSVTGDCLNCSGTEEAVVKSAYKKFHTKV